MKYKVILMAAAAAVMAACSGEKQKTQLKGVYEPAEEAPAAVEVIVGEQLDTVVALVDGRFSLEIPTDKRAVSYVVLENEPIQFVADGSTLTINLTDGSVASSSKKGVQSRMNSFMEWQEDFIADYEAGMEGLSPEGQAALLDKTLEAYNRHLIEVINQNPDNVLGLMAVSSLEIDDPGQMMTILRGLSEELRSIPSIVRMMGVCQTQAATGEGQMFQDFDVYQDPDNPATAVHFSDFVGKGKYILVDFWASWCGPCREETPYLKAVYEKYKGDRFDMLSVAVSDDPEDSRKAVEELGMNWNQMFNAQQIPGTLYGVQYIPHIMLIGPDGVIIKRGLRGEGIEKAVAEALAQ